jgi:hypothetical protein
MADHKRQPKPFSALTNEQDEDLNRTQTQTPAPAYEADATPYMDFYPDAVELPADELWTTVTPASAAQLWGANAKVGGALKMEQAAGGNIGLAVASLDNTLLSRVRILGAPTGFALDRSCKLMTLEQMMPGWILTLIPSWCERSLSCIRSLPLPNPSHRLQGRNQRHG